MPVAKRRASRRPLGAAQGSTASLAAAYRLSDLTGIRRSLWSQARQSDVTRWQAIALARTASLAFHVAVSQHDLSRATSVALALFQWNKRIISKLVGKVALITGAARGLGRAYAKRPAGLGAKVAVADRNLHAYEEFEAEARDMIGENTVAEIEATGSTRSASRLGQCGSGYFREAVQK